jgi:hypothetical protein
VIGGLALKDKDRESAALHSQPGGQHNQSRAAA